MLIVVNLGHWLIGYHFEPLAGNSGGKNRVVVITFHRNHVVGVVKNKDRHFVNRFLAVKGQCSLSGHLFELVNQDRTGQLGRFPPQLV